MILKNVTNMRQLGGYRGADGRKVKDGVLFRTGALAEADRQELSHFCEQYRITDIIDFRTNEERVAAPDPRLDDIRYTHISVLGKDIEISGEQEERMRHIKTTENFALRYKLMYEMDVPIQPDIVYENLLFGKAGKKGYEKFFRILLDETSDGGILFHCTQGKDRTGVATALILSVLGVARETVLEDYLLTNEAVRPLLERIKREIPQVTDDEEVLKFALFMESVDRAYLEPRLSRIDSEYGSVCEYVKSELHLTDSDIDKLRERYLTP